VPKPRNGKVDRKEIISKISLEWKSLPKKEKAQYQIEAKRNLNAWKRKKDENELSLYHKAMAQRESGRGIVKNQR
jgi:hypothetical protein